MNQNLLEQYKALGLSEKVIEFGAKIEAELKPRFEQIDAVAEFNQLKVLNAMQKNRVAENHFAESTGYGYNDAGRETLEQVYADTFHTETALVRPQLTCGTHALTIALSANLRPGDELYSPVGKPYDTLEGVIGIRDSVGSLKEYGVSYRQTDLLPDGSFDYDNIAKAINAKTKLVTIQRSKGYATRPTLSVKRIAELIAFIKNIKPDVIVVDPPRKGCDQACLDTMLKMQPKRIVYVSCDSATLARDLRILCDGGYEIEKIRATDQFPHTGHVETCVLLTHKKCNDFSVKIEVPVKAL